MIRVFLRMAMTLAAMCLGASSLGASSLAADPGIDQKSTPRDTASDAKVSADTLTRETLAGFEKGDPGWRVRMESLVRLVRLGNAAVPALVDALKGGSPSAREFAAQTLAILADPATRPALLGALDDPEPKVRVHAVKALTMFGPLELTDRQRQGFEDNTHWMLRHYIEIAQARDDKPNPAAIQQTLVDYDLHQIDTARLGYRAPDFTLADDTGQTHRLSQLRDKIVILEFHSGDG